MTRYCVLVMDLERGSLGIFPTTPLSFGLGRLMFKISLLGLSLMLMVGCVSNDAHVVTPEVFSQSRTGQIEARKLRPGDMIEFSVEVNGVPEVPLTKVQLGYDGVALAPLVGDVQLDLLTLAQARLALEKVYGRIFVASPLIRLNLANAEAGEWGYVTVLGQVRNPGRFPISSIAGMNLSDALYEAGGFGENANLREVIATRNTDDGGQVQCVSDITQLGKVDSGHCDLILFYGDIVYVPERLF